MAAIAKLASTVVLMDDLSRIYLTKRPITMKFMGGVHVFPGGAVDETDHDISTTHVNTEVLAHSFSPAHYIAAARELFEEIGILLGTKIDGSPLQLTNDKKINYRRQLQNGEISFNQVLEQEGLHLDLQCLTYFGQIVTPEEMPIRFDTCFFIAKLPQAQTPEPDQTEVDEGIWITPEEALTAYQNKEIKLPPPTIIALQTIINYQNNGDELMMSVTREDLMKLLNNKR
jgi:8-oxo-dGTP pyrophosphatase MutT (NUDIX family)